MKIVKKLKKLQLVFWMKLHQRRYKRLKYLFVKGRDEKHLIVSFSSFPGKGKKSVYNYFSTLKNVDCSKLFILDHFGYKKGGSYYLGENGNWFVPEQVISLIEKVKTENALTKLITIGSSKGGTAALYFAIKCHAKFAVIGAPQYNLADYLNNDEHQAILSSIVGEVNEKSIQRLNSVMPHCISEATDDKPEVYIHYSPFEHTYVTHIAQMLAALKQYNFDIEEDNNYTYTVHGDVGKYFPQYLLATLNKNI